MKKVKGSVSLFAAMIFLLIASVITMTVRAARVHGAKVMVRTASSMALDSVFAEYNYQLFSEFGILLFDGKQGKKTVSKDRIAAKLWDYMEYNLDIHKDLSFSGSTDLYGINMNGVSVDRLIMATEHSGLLWENMAVEYEKYAKPVNLAAEYLGFESKSKEAQAVDEISGSIMECTERILKINRKVRLLVEFVDGIVCPEDGIDYTNVETQDSFVKKFCPFAPTYDNMRINQYILSQIVSREVVNPLDKVKKAKQYFLAGMKQEARTEIAGIESLAAECARRIESADSFGMFIGADVNLLDKGLENIDTLIETNSEYLSDEVMEGLSEEVVHIQNYREVMAEELCDVDAIMRRVQQNKAVLESVIELIDGIGMDEDADTLQTKLSELETVIKKYSFDGLEFNYARLEKSSEDTSILDALSRFLENGVLAIVVPEGKSISTNVVPRLPDSASNICQREESENTIPLTDDGSEATMLAKRIIYAEYVMDNFSDFMDEKGRTVVNYEVEYVICGEKSDKKNLTETVMRIAALRSGINMVYLLTDSEKKEEAHDMALMLAGPSAMEPVVKLLQYTFMYVWSFAEGLSDVRRLLAGEKIELTKSRDTWNLSFDKLMSHDFSCDSDKSKNKNGLDYEMFLRILLYLESDSLKAAYTMDLVEFYMILHYDKEFRLKDYVYGMEISTGYGLKGIQNSYTEKSAYTY